MSLETARQLIAAKAEAAASLLSFPVESEGGKSRQDDTLWGAWSIMFGDVAKITIGRKRNVRCTGYLTFQIFSPLEQGTKVFTAAYDIIAGAVEFTEASEAGTVVSFREVSLISAGPRDGYLQKNIACKFVRDTYN